MLSFMRDHIDVMMQKIIPDVKIHCGFSSSIIINYVWENVTAAGEKLDGLMHV